MPPLEMRRGTSVPGPLRRAKIGMKAGSGIALVGRPPLVRAGPPGPAAAPGTKFGAKRTGRRGRRPRTRGPPTGFSRVSAPHGWSGRAHRCEPQTLPWHAAFASGRGAGAVLIHTTYDELWQMPSTSGAGCGNGRYGYLSAFRLCLRSIARER